MATQTATKSNTAPTDRQPDKPPRTRASISPAKALAIVVAGLVGICTSKAVAAVLTPEQRAQVTAANNAAREMNAKTIQPVLDRIKAIQGEFKQIDITAPDAAQQAKDLATELGRKQAKLKALTASA